jgi:hypothetical protein
MAPLGQSLLRLGLKLTNSVCCEVNSPSPNFADNMVRTVVWNRFMPDAQSYGTKAHFASLLKRLLGGTTGWMIRQAIVTMYLQFRFYCHGRSGAATPFPQLVCALCTSLKLPRGHCFSVRSSPAKLIN